MEKKESSSQRMPSKEKENQGHKKRRNESARTNALRDKKRRRNESERKDKSGLRKRRAAAMHQEGRWKRKGLLLFSKCGRNTTSMREISKTNASRKQKRGVTRLHAKEGGDGGKMPFFSPSAAPGVSLLFSFWIRHRRRSASLALRVSSCSCCCCDETS